MLKLIIPPTDQKSADAVSGRLAWVVRQSISSNLKRSQVTDRIAKTLSKTKHVSPYISFILLSLVNRPSKNVA